MSEKDTAVFSPMAAKPSPEPSDEAQIETANQPAAEAAPAEAGETRPDGPTETTAEPAATNWEQRAKDSQRALSERDRALQELKVELEVLKRTAGVNSQPARDVKAEIEKLEEDVRNDPANAVRYMHQILAMRDEHYARELQGIRSEFERKTIERDPDYKAVQDSLKAVQDIEAFAGLPLAAQIEVAKRMRAQSQPVQMQPRGGVGAVRAVAPKKEPTNDERFGPWLRASGAVKAQAPKGVVQFAMGQ